MPPLARIRLEALLLLYGGKGLLAAVVILARGEIGGLLAPLIVLAFSGSPWCP